MPTKAATPKLPAELLLSVFSHLRRHDLAQVCKANSYLRSLARPLFYHFGTLTKFGLHFPGAPSPYPFLDLPELGHASFSSDALERLSADLRAIDLPAHLPSDCAAYRNLKMEDLPCHPEVLRIQCAVRVLEDHDEEAPGGDFPHIEPFPSERRCEHAVDGSCDCVHDCSYRRCEYYCFFRSFLVFNKTFDKVVLRDGPMAMFYYDDRRLPEVRPRKEFVAVLDSHDITKTGDHVHGCDIITWGLRPFWGSQVVTVVLWTGSPERGWIPPCIKGSHERWMSPTAAGNDEGFQRECQGMEFFWADMGEQIGFLKASGPACTTVRIVNALSIIECHVSYDTGEYRKRRIRSTGSIESAFREGARDALRGEDWEGDVQFWTMEEWVALGEWEDVFTRKEIEPFLRR
ncbi:hypothetical protein A1Q1_05638 [Trichosporon asahii var. asahii CBS 2479]|uniref:F-box domain-containing protein n=1 Tax=Trichosporon asahii var. asahii (strain ATCC 90039 / CBS 2479 / JCM 2466 / KCTC 7840 / NBRC 103889/ NCYC 2677 / UAMH 7654) TaxID=1186058 RepID=J5Q7P2_TRIAS|nr:hypothetical protein A1Q1_05638 [Trichosporon asahii var. asahii CBS 2479]EJT45913.1 hypothetical protein A1Q1_05638 [Trichosporon asahii var. asahii CBS 2479]